MNEIHEAIPHRPPFLFIDKVIERTESSIAATKWLDPSMDVFKGHFPECAIFPGVLICEAVVQAGAILLSGIDQASQSAEGKDSGEAERVPALTRMRDVKFKRMARPGDRLELRAELVERVFDVYMMRGRALVDGKVAATLEFACAMVPRPDRPQAKEAPEG